MNRPPESFTCTVKYHTGTLGAKVGVVVGSKEYVRNAPFLGDYTEKSAHLERCIRLGLEINPKVGNIISPDTGGTIFRDILYTEGKYGKGFISQPLAGSASFRVKINRFIGPGKRSVGAPLHQYCSLITESIN